MTRAVWTERNGAARLFGVGILIAGIGSVVTFGAMILEALEKVRAGHGLDTYRTFWLFEFNWIGFLTFCVAMAVALVVGLGFRFRECLEIRALVRRYGSKNKDA